MALSDHFRFMKLPGKPPDYFGDYSNYDETLDREYLRQREIQMQQEAEAAMEKEMAEEARRLLSGKDATPTAFPPIEVETYHTAEDDETVYPNANHWYVLQSTNVSAIRWNTIDQTLDVEYQDNRFYRYFDVPYVFFVEFWHSSSPGRTVWEDIRRPDAYYFTKNAANGVRPSNPKDRWGHPFPNIRYPDNLRGNTGKKE